MTRDEASELLEAVSAGWVEDVESDVVWAGEHDGRWGVRVAQQTRDFTTVWFEVGERTLSWEAYVLPAPPANREEVYRQCLARNSGSWPVWFSIDRHADLYLRGRMPLGQVSRESLDGALGAVYEMVETAFRSLVRSAFGAREKTP